MVAKFLVTLSKIYQMSVRYTEIAKLHPVREYNLGNPEWPKNLREITFSALICTNITRILTSLKFFITRVWIFLKILPAFFKQSNGPEGLKLIRPPWHRLFSLFNVHIWSKSIKKSYVSNLAHSYFVLQLPYEQRLRRT